MSDTQLIVEMWAYEEILHYKIMWTINRLNVLNTYWNNISKFTVGLITILWISK